MSSIINIKIGMLIRKIRKSKNISQYKLSYKAEFVTRMTLIRIEKGETNPSIDTLKDICDALDIKLKDIFNELDI